MSNKKGKQCPICANKQKAVHRSENVCELHQDWVVTVCPKCESPIFAKKAEGWCVQCTIEFNIGTPSIHIPQPAPGPRDHRFYLRMIGQEGKPMRGF